ncbi:NAD(P)/FAD-dependent oxidoreductase [Streptomyces sp. NPDC002666]
MISPHHRPRDVLIIGGSLAGLRAAETLRAEGFTGALTIVGDEHHAPYDRPPLSKQFLSAGGEPPDTRLPVPENLHARWLLGRAAVALNPRNRTVTLVDGTPLTYDGLLIATGASARGLPGAPEGVYTLRRRSDAEALREALAACRRLLVVGAGFLGSEVAAAGRARGLDVTLVEAGAVPLERAVGKEVGAFVGELHREAGIMLRTGTTVTRFSSDQAGRLTGALLADGTAVAADVAVLALGAAPASDWLIGSGLRIGGGVHGDSRMRALSLDGGVVPGVVVAGDVAKTPQPLADGAALSFGHWSDAVGQAASAARTLLLGEANPPWDGIPSFWSDLHGAQIRSVGLPGIADTVEIHEMDLSTRRLEAGYHRSGRLVGALTLGRTGRLAVYRNRLAGTASRAEDAPG